MMRRHGDGESSPFPNHQCYKRTQFWNQNLQKSKLQKSKLQKTRKTKTVFFWNLDNTRKTKTAFFEIRTTLQLVAALSKHSVEILIVRRNSTSAWLSLAHLSPLQEAKKHHHGQHRHKPSAAASKPPSHQPPVTRYSRKISSSTIVAAIWWSIWICILYIYNLLIINRGRHRFSLSFP